MWLFPSNAKNIMYINDFDFFINIQVDTHFPKAPKFFSSLLSCTMPLLTPTSSGRSLSLASVMPALYPANKDRESFLPDVANASINS
jgi:hypothetical protein